MIVRMRWQRAIRYLVFLENHRARRVLLAGNDKFILVGFQDIKRPWVIGLSKERTLKRNVADVGL